MLIFYDEMICHSNYFYGMNKTLLIFVCIFFSLNISAQKLYPVKIKGLFGYMNTEGKMIISPKFDFADEFSDGFAVVALNLQPCLIDVNENRAIDTGLYQFIGKFSEGLCAVTDFKQNKFYLNNKAEKTISLSREFYEAHPFYNGIARIAKKIDYIEQKFGMEISRIAYRFGYINKNGDSICSFIYDDAEDMFEEVARVKINSKFGLINSMGNEILNPNYSNLSSFSEGLAVVEKAGKFGYINTKGEEIIAIKFEYSTMFNNGFAAFIANNKYGFIDKEGAIKIEAIYDDVRPFGEGLAAVLIGKKWSFINTKGETQMQPYYDNVAFFNDGLCPVMKNKKWGAIDKTGRLILQLDYDYVSPFEDGIARIVFSEIELYADTNGKVLPVLEKKN